MRYAPLSSLYYLDVYEYNLTAHFQGDQNGQFFHTLGYFWRLIMVFWKDEVAQSNDNSLGYSLFKHIYYIFT